jgi:hypothetical protein
MNFAGSVSPIGIIIQLLLTQVSFGEHFNRNLESYDMISHNLMLYLKGCNGHDPHSFTNGQSDVEMAKSSLHRYLHYYKRFHSHSQAQDFAIKSVKETDARVIHFQEKNPDAVWIEAGFLEAANRQLVECRRVLKYSYAFAYYLQDGDKKTRFEYHQLMLERFTKNLSEHTEKPIQDINRTEVVNQVSTCLSRVRKATHSDFISHQLRVSLLHSLSALDKSCGWLHNKYSNMRQ